MTTRVLSVDIGIINFSYCIVDFTEDDFEVIHIEKMAIGTMKQAACTLATSLIDLLRASQPINDKPIHYVFIEAQMSRAIKNTILGYTVYSYFYTESCFSRSGVKISFVPPKMKFHAIEKYFPGVAQDIVCRSKDLKKLSISIARNIFTTLEVTKGLEAFEKYKPKLDDISDVFLQSFSIFLEK